jgi:hypothetical protein
MNAFSESFRRLSYGDMREGERENFSDIQEVVPRRIFGYAIILRREVPISNMQLDYVASNVMAVFGAYDEEFAGRDVNMGRSRDAG